MVLRNCMETLRDNQRTGLNKACTCNNLAYSYFDPNNTPPYRYTCTCTCRCTAHVHVTCYPCMSLGSLHVHDLHVNIYTFTCTYM